MVENTKFSFHCTVVILSAVIDAMPFLDIGDQRRFAGNIVFHLCVEYDTIDAGHILVILPEHVKLLLMECRGLPVRVLQDSIHRAFLRVAMHIKFHNR